MTRNKRLEIKLSEQEYAKLQKESNRKGVSMSEVLRDFVKSLPD
jgi:hypothetical protein